MFKEIFTEDKNLDRLMSEAYNALSNLKIETATGYDKKIKKDFEKVLKAFDNLRITVKNIKD